MDIYKSLKNLDLKKGAYISFIDIKPSTKRRLIDLGFSTGRYVVPVFKSPLGDPTAYSVSGSVIALREDIASHIMVTEENSDE